MKRLLRIFLIVSLLLGAAACRKGPKIIPQKEFGRLYAELLLADQWVKLHPAERRTADTTLVYAEVLSRHGYTDEQVVASMKYYLRDPLRYRRSLDVTVSELEKHYNELDAELTAQDHVRDFLRRYRGRNGRRDTIWISPVGLAPVLDSTVLRIPEDTLYWQNRDSLLPRPAYLFIPSDLPVSL